MDHETLFRITKGKKAIVVVEVSTRSGTEDKPETDFSKWTYQDVLDGCVPLVTAVSLLGMTNIDYVRRILREGRIEGLKIVSRGRLKWIVTRESIKDYKENAQSRLSYRRYVLKIGEEHEDAIRAFLDSLECKYTLEFNYQSKEKQDDADWLSA